MGEPDRATVLVVEDEAPLIEIYARWLEGRYEVRTAQDGEAALEQFDEAVDVVLLDRLMPGISGDEVLAAIEATGLNPRTAMVTAVEPDFDIVRMGFDDYLTKPVTREELVATVERLLSRNSFAELEREYYSLVEKKAALQSTKSVEELERSDEYAELQRRIDTLTQELDAVMPEVDDGDLVAMIRDIELDAELEMSEDGRRGDSGGANRS